MSQPLTKENPKGSTWGPAIPKRWTPIATYAIASLALNWAAHTGLVWRWVDFQFALDALTWSGFAALVALVAMLRAPIRLRLMLLVFVVATRLAIEFLKDTSANRDQTSSLELLDNLRYQLADDVTGFALIAIFAHGVTSLFSVFVSTTAPAKEEFKLARQGRIADWLYIVFLCSLLLLPRPTFHIWPGDVVWESLDFRRFCDLVFTPNIPLGVPLTGLLILSFLSSWRFGLLNFVCLLLQCVGSITYYGHWDHPSGIGTTFFTFLLFVSQSFPFWLLLRWAGYRIHSPHRWIDAPKNSVDQTRGNAAP